MKLTNIKKDGKVLLGVMIEDKIALMTGKEGYPQTTQEAIDLGIEGLGKLDLSGLDTVDVAGVTYAPVVTEPEKIICVGLNYLKHAEETGSKIPEVPCLFSKFNNALAACGEDIELIPVETEYDYEAELVIVVGKGGKNISEADAKGHVFGYTCGNDMSARSLQRRTGQWISGKTLDKFAPIGPVIATADVTDGDNLAIKLMRNGTVCQDSSTNDLIFNISKIISYISSLLTLKAGDIIFTGTPSGVIGGKAEKDWLQKGEVLSVEIEGIGTLTNKLV